MLSSHRDGLDLRLSLDWDLLLGRLLLGEPDLDPELNLEPGFSPSLSKPDLSCPLVLAFRLCLLPLQRLGPLWACLAATPALRGPVLADWGIVLALLVIAEETPHPFVFPAGFLIPRGAIGERCSGCRCRGGCC